MTMNYTSLVADTKAWLERTQDSDLNAEIPTFISLAQIRIAKEVKVLASIFFATDSFTAGTNGAVVEKPAYWRADAYFNYAVGVEGDETTAPYTKRRTLLKRAYDFCRNYWPDQAETGEPRFYADYGAKHWLIVPTPSTAWPFEIGYQVSTEPLSETNQSNWITENSPDLMLYATLLEAAVYIKNAAEIEKFQKLFDRAAAALSAETQGLVSDYQSGPVAGGQ